MMRMLKFQHKIYLLSFFFIVLFIGSSYILQNNIKNISNKLQVLNQQNESLQETLIQISEIEKLHKYVHEFNNFGDLELLQPIETILSQLTSLKDDSKFIENDTHHKKAYLKIIDNIKNFQDDFKIAKSNVPMSFAFRKELRQKAQKLEDEIDEIKDNALSIEVLFELVSFKKSILEIEKGVVRYFETDNGQFVIKVKNEHKILKKHLLNIANTKNNILRKEINRLKSDTKELISLSNKIISHYRTYSMITKVVLPGDMYEINHYAQILQSSTKEKINFIKEEINQFLIANKNFSLAINIIYTFIVILSFLLLIRIVLKPIENLTKMFQDLLDEKENVAIPKYQQNDMIGKLTQAAVKFKKLSMQTKELLMQTEDYKRNLEVKVQKEINLRREKEKALIQQSKLASMGEMIGAIAHQWRQPLNELSIRIQKLKYKYASDQIDEKYIEEFVSNNKQTIDFMSKTIDDFRNFFRIDKNKREFHIKESIYDAISILSAQLKGQFIEVEYDDGDFVYNGYKTEFQQVLINLISNTKDAFISNSIKEPRIDIKVKDNSIVIQDNAGGIPEDILDRVFEPYFTTKDQGEGTGMGLYMSKMIIEDNMKGKIVMINKDDGVEVIIKLGV